MAEIESKQLRTWLAIATGIIFLLAQLGYHLVSTSDNSPALGLLQNKVDQLTRDIEATRLRLDNMDKRLYEMDSRTTELKFRVEWLEKSRR